MNGMKATKKRITAMLFAALLVLSSVDYDVLSATAAEGAGTVCLDHTEHTADCGCAEAVEGAGTACPNHTEHTADCGYVEAVEGAGCTHEHTDDCYRTVTECVHEHGDECYEKTLTCEDTEEGHEHTDACYTETVICTHTCSEESGCIRRELDCRHEHDESCGYVEAVEGQLCIHSCELCSGAAEESTEEETADTEEDLPEKQAEAEASAVDSEISSWAELQAALKTSGEYKLTCDVESTEDSWKGVLEVPADATVTLDLAGYKVDRSLDSSLSDGQVMKVSGTLTVNDSGGSGVITGGYGSGIDMKGAAVYVKSGGSFTLNGGSIRDNRTSADSNHATGVGVENNATFIMNGGVIRDNHGEGSGSLGGGVGADSSATVKLLGGRIVNNDVAGSYGGGLFFYGSNVTVGGSIEIKDNIVKYGEISNVAGTKSGPVLLLSEDVPLTKDAKIGWTVNTYDGVVANGTPVAKGKNAANYVDNFFSDQDSSYIIGVKAGDAETIYIATADSTVVSKPGAPVETHEHNGKTFVPWSADNIRDLGNGNSNILAGSYYLTEDVTAGTELIVSGVTVDICLNGHTFDLNGKAFFLESGAELNIYDCDANQSTGKITNGGGHSSGDKKGGAVYVKGSTLNLYGGSLEGNSAVWGGAIFIDASSGKSTVNMYGGVIQNNTATKGGGGIEVEDAQSYFYMSGGSIINNQVEKVDASRHKGGGVHFNQTNMTIDGKVNISGNTVAGVENNVYLRSGKSITVKLIEEGSRIGVSASDIEDSTSLETYTITNGYQRLGTSDIKYFFLDGTHSKSQYALTHNGNELQIQKHTHAWKYVAGTGDNANKLYAYCNTSTPPQCGYYGADCTKLPLVITAQSPFTSTGSAYNGAKLSADELSEFNAATGNSLSDASIVYYKDAALSEKTTTKDGASGAGKAPVNAGTYYAAVSVGDASAKAEFTIKAAVTEYRITLVRATAKAKDGTTGQQETGYEAGKEVILTADAPGEGEVFDHWETTGIELDDAQKKKSVITITMPDNDISVTAVYRDTKAPVLGGIKDGGKYCGSVTVTVTDNNLDKVTLDGKNVTLTDDRFVIPGDDSKHTVRAEDTASNVTEYTVTVYKGHDFEHPGYKETGREGNVITEEALCGHGCGRKITRKKTTEGDIISQEDPNGDGSSGKLATEVQVEPGTPAVRVSGLDVKTAREVLTPAELAEVKSGKDLLVYLEIKKLEEAAVNADDISKTKEQAEAKKLQKGIYLDLSMWKKIGDAAASKLGSTQLSKDLKITLTLPDELKAPAGKTRTYYVIRVHGGTAVVLDTKCKGNEISFMTDSFSTYSVWYTEKDTPASQGGSDGTPGKTGTPDQSGASASSGTQGGSDGSGSQNVQSVQSSPAGQSNQSGSSTSVGAPKTGDESNMALWVMLLLLSAVVLAGITAKRKKDSGFSL